MGAKIKVAAVSYLNTKPLLYGIERSSVMDDIELVSDYPAKIAKSLQDGDVDVALLPVAVIPQITNAHIICDYGIAADGNVASVAIFSQVPMEEIQTVYLDYQSRTSVRLAQLLLEKYWKRQVEFKPATENYIDYINGTTAGVIIGDRALKQLTNFEYIYDLATGWKEYTGLPFVFAAWVANKELPQDFIDRFNEANAVGLAHIDDIVAEIPFPYYDLHKYYTENIHYRLDGRKREGLEEFLSLIR
ncbi:menaquinone biosynthetic enzyme MqnA/MqnD family protein [Polluticoccus soli]|uniref:menaquinone biosynthetic enzyme MqnA/MqnD family protein n=1 Tax=Polluticoccus soli TaxID=3034150 RepID=UPI0023E09247|nr:menaquinone biosynthesis protein [Flavipsychrobacter sp. JY13-12]